MYILSEIWEGFRIALRAIRANKLRTFLTTLGIIIGITSVTAMATVINGLDQNFEDQLSELGTDVLYIEKWPWARGPGFKWWNYINRPDIEAELAEVVADRSKYAVAAAPVVNTSRAVRYGDKSLSGVGVQGSTANYPKVFSVDIASGRYFGELEDRSGRNVSVIGAGIAEELFPIEEPIGKQIRIAGVRFQVIGVLAKKGSSAEGQGSADMQIQVPFSAFKNNFGMSRRSASVRVRVINSGVMDDAKDELTGILRTARRLDAKEENDFEINEQRTLREQLAPIKLTIYSIGIFLTALSLLVGGIGVMNIMFVSVKERTREIGVRKAIGAKRRTILMQFLIEAVLVCVLGGLIGVLFSVLITFLINLVFTAILPVSTVLIAFLICILIGVIFGLAPAWTAAKAEPIEALRYE
ncbi:MAG: ABC transporter permease [Rhodothermales bacterium]